MRKSNRVFVGCDLGDKHSDYCLIDGKGVVREEGRLRTTTEAFTRKFRRMTRSIVVVEVGTHSRWVEALLRKLGHEVVVANARQVRLIWQRTKKTDRSDALLLARLGRMDVTLLAPVKHRSRAAQRDLAVLRARDVLVRSRTKLVNFVRGSMKPFGTRFPSCAPEAMPKIAAEAPVPAELRPALAPILQTIEVLNTRIAAQDKLIEELAAAHPETDRLRQVAGVGPITSLAYVLTIDDPSRFSKSRVAASFLGLTPGKDQSGEHDPQKRITRAGDPFLRRMLVQCAHYILGPHGARSDLRTWGLSIVDRGGRDPKKRAIVAVARKLAVLLHKLWVTGEEYQPIGYAHRAAA